MITTSNGAIVCPVCECTSARMIELFSLVDIDPVSAKETAFFLRFRGECGHLFNWNILQQDSRCFMYASEWKPNLDVAGEVAQIIGKSRDYVLAEFRKSVVDMAERRDKKKVQ